MIRFFKTQNDFRKWLEKNSDNTPEIFVGFYKVHTKIKSITYPQALDEALCFGWIDGVRRSIDDKRYQIRFTPRRKGSKWSKVNIKRAKELLRTGKMTNTGRIAFKNLSQAKDIEYSYVKKVDKLSPEYEKIFRLHNDAWKYFEAQAPYYKRTVSSWIISAKKEETILRRLDLLIKDCEKKKRIDLLNPGKKISKK